MTTPDLTLSLIGIGCGNPDHLTLQAIAEINRADLILIPDKGAGKGELAQLRDTILSRHLHARAKVRRFAMPVRRDSGDYLSAVSDWHDAIARAWLEAIAAEPGTRRVALLVWGDPSLYDSTLRIAERLSGIRLRVVPGITSISALCAAHGIALNDLSAPVAILPARHLRDHGWPQGIATIAVMLDDGSALAGCPGPARIHWGAYLGMAQQDLIRGDLDDLRDTILSRRAALRQQHGWIMDAYLLTKPRDGIAGSKE